MTTATMSAPWTDSKRYLWLLSPFVPMLALIALGFAQWTGWLGLAWLAPALVYVIIPICDWLFGTDAANPPESAVPTLEHDPYYRLIVFAYIPMQFLVTAWATWLAVTAHPNGWQLIGLVLASGSINGIGINTAHELGHKTDGLERWLAKLTLAPVAYGHFFVEHNRGHHVRVATPEDPASARFGETFWEFFPRTVIGSVKSAWEIETRRLARSGKGPWTWQNENLQAWAMTAALFGALTAWLGWTALPFLIAQAIYGFSLLESVNYLEHYGLCRQKLPDGRYERCQPHHSWNSNHIVTNLFLYQLQRHSDHHAYPTRRFQALRHFDDCPQLPSGYASMILLAYLPPIWFRLMNPKVVAHYKHDMTRANIKPSIRDEVIARYPPLPA